MRMDCSAKQQLIYIGMLSPQTDVFVDVHKKLRVVRRQPAQPKRKGLAPILKGRLSNV